jgi:hypothetical protein
MELRADTQCICKGTLIGEQENNMCLGSGTGSNCRELFWALFYFMYLLNDKSERNIAQNNWFHQLK